MSEWYSKHTKKDLAARIEELEAKLAKVIPLLNRIKSYRVFYIEELEDLIEELKGQDMSDYIKNDSIEGGRVNHFIEPPRPKSKWSIGPEFDVTFYTPSPMPNWFHRTMQRLILGIYWKKADE
jgi:hypothetical protein